MFVLESSPTVDRAPIVAALISSLIVAAVVCFVLGCVLGCAGGWFGHKRYKITTQAKSEKDANAEPAPLYEDLQPTSSTPEDQGKAFELRENVAYGPIRAINVK